ncbi:VIT-domain-containing protein [Exidia glandulosa HHB12029]|uniref:VIT-domain-containing protein n=1 Tax=Exidia glandulosa HHB12029 TaxID=1314781 RepID=A0A166AF04_EXIGL|nr:VIT-domain-containing protein [Exidia glandulosa HHB12029]
MADSPHGLASQDANGSTVFQPLKSVAVRATVIDTSAHVIVTQTFQNTSASEARYIFPTPANAAVCAFRMQTSGGRAVHARVKELERAKEDFESALAQDKWAGLLQEVAADAFVMSVGAIPRGEDVSFVITYVQELPQDESVKQIRFTFPTFVAERYGPLPAPLQGASSQSERATLSIVVDARMTSPIERIHSPTHSIVTTYATPNVPSLSAIVTLDNTARPPSRKDFVLSIQADAVASSRCVAEVDERRQSVALSLTLVPNLAQVAIPAQEYIFLLDRSGSMQEDDRIDFAKAALQIFMRSLPAENTRFNVVGFGSHSVPMWASSRPYTPATLDYATVQVDAMEADMGGTEIQAALQDAISSRSGGMPTSIFVLTDGKIWHTNRVLSFLHRHVSAAGSASAIRVFTLGVGDGASTELCEGLARVGNGICFMASFSEDIAGRCASLLKAARVLPSGNLHNLSIEWGHGHVHPSSLLQTGRDIVSPDVQQTPSSIPDLYPDTRIVLSAILSQTTAIPPTVTLRGLAPDDRPTNMTFPVQDVTQERDRLLHVLAARRLITELDDGILSAFDSSDPVAHARDAKAAIVRLSEEYQLASRYAAFVAVDETDAGSTATSEESPVKEEKDGHEAGSDSELEDDSSSEASYKTAESSPREDEEEDEHPQGLSNGANGAANGRRTSETTSSTTPPAHQSEGVGPPTRVPSSSPPVAYALSHSRRRTALGAAGEGAIMFIANSFVLLVQYL